MSIFNLKQVIPLNSFGIDKKKYHIFVKRVAVALGLIAFIATYLQGVGAYGFIPWVFFGWLLSGLVAWMSANLIYHALKPS